MSMCDQVAMAFEIDSGTLFRHGSPNTVTSWVNENQERAVECDFRIGTLLFPRKHPVDEINRCLTNSAFIGELYRRLMQGEPLA